jgi:outer membrane protein
MNRTLVLVTALAAGMTSAAGVAQTAAPQTSAAPAAPIAPQAVPAKIAIISFEQAAAATNEGQHALQDLQKKYEPQQTHLQALKTEIDSLTKQLQSAPATLSDDEKASRARTIETKQKQLDRDAEDARTAYGNDMQDAVGKVAQKLGPVVMKYVQQNGYTMLLDNAPQQQQGGGLSLLWAAGGSDISQAVVDAYNASSGVSAPTPAAATHPRTTTPAPKPAAPKQ